MVPTTGLPRVAAALACLLSAIGVATTCAAAAKARSDFETASLLPGAALAAPALLQGPLHTVTEPVPLDGVLGHFTMTSKFGTFSIVGANMLNVRVNELQAIEALQEVQNTRAFQDSLVRAAQAPIQLVQSAVTNPLGTVENVGQGLGSMLGRVGFLARSGAQSIADSAGSTAPTPSRYSEPPAGEAPPPPFNGDPFGYNKARRDWARQLNIDPYTSNPILRPLLDNASAASFAGSFAINTAISTVSMGANLVIAFDTDVRDAVWNLPPVDLARQNEAQLQAMGVSGRTTRAFLRNRWFTPSLQTALVAGLGKIGGVPGMESVIQLASQLQGEVRIRFLVESVRMLGTFHHKETTLTQLRMSGMVPVGKVQDGTLVIAAATDYVEWNEAAAEFLQRKEFKGKRPVLLTAGGASERARQAFGDAGWRLRTGLRTQ